MKLNIKFHQSFYTNFKFQDNNGTIENEELNGFLKDLLELVKKVSTCKVQIICNTDISLHVK